MKLIMLMKRVIILISSIDSIITLVFPNLIIYTYIYLYLHIYIYIYMCMLQLIISITMVSLFSTSHGDKPALHTPFSLC